MRCRGPAALGLGAGLQAMASALSPAPASAAPLGVLLDYAAGVLQAADLCSSGALGAIRYVSDRRPGGAWMLGKRIQLAEARDLYQNGLKIVSYSQFRKQDTADWLGGQNAGVEHAQRGWQLHLAAGGSYGAPIYASIDDDPSYDQYKSKVAPYLKGWEAVLGHQRSASTRTPKPSNGRCRTGSAPTSGSTTGVRTGGHPPGRTSAPGRDRQGLGQGRWGGHQQQHEATVRSVGAKTYRPVMKFSKLFSVADEPDEPMRVQLSAPRGAV